MLTRRWLQLIAEDDQRIWRIPFGQPGPEYTEVRISMLQPQGQFAVWVRPSHEAETRNPGKLPIHVTWFNAAQDVLKKAELRPLSSPYIGNTDKFMSVVMPPAVMFALYFFADQPIPLKFPLISLVIASLIFVPAGLVIGRRYNVSAGAQINWGFFHLLFGLPGFLAFLSVNEWPARERCANCNKLRVVNRQLCEHCGAEFPPLAKDGTEIFEPLITAPSQS